MSKAIRIRDHLYEEIAALAERENRPLIRQLEELLEQALRLTRVAGSVTAQAERSSPQLPTEEKGWPGEHKPAEETWPGESSFKPDFGTKLGAKPGKKK